MEKYFEICHTQIPYSQITEYRIETKEYIYRPKYVAYAAGMLHNRIGYQFIEMIPYAAIIGEDERKLATRGFKIDTFGLAIGHDVLGYADSIATAIGEKLNIKGIKYNKYLCINPAGRTFHTYLEDIPAKVVDINGRESEALKGSPLYAALGEPIIPSINMINALVIYTKDTKTKEEKVYVYYDGIQVKAEYEYERLKYEHTAVMSVLEQEKLLSTENKGLKGVLNKLPQVNMPALGLQAKKGLPQLGNKLTRNLHGEYVDIVDMDAQYDPMDLNHDGVVDEKDLELMKQKITNERRY